MPTFKVMKLTEAGWEGDVSTATVSTSGGEQTWVACGCRACLRDGQNLIWGKWRRLNGRGWCFEPQHKSQRPPENGLLDCFDDYWGERLQWVVDRSLGWTKAAWTGEGDHDHCIICWQKIGMCGERFYYDCGTRDRSCVGCYEKHISCGDISFVPGQ